MLTRLYIPYWWRVPVRCQRVAWMHYLQHPATVSVSMARAA